MVSFRPSEKRKPLILDPIREAYVSSAPEEKIRQWLLHHLTQGLGYPKELIAVEKELTELAHVESGAPQRRADIICFAKGIHPEYALYPLLLIECKRAEIDSRAIKQVLGYNHYVKAPFVALAALQGVMLVYPKKLDFIPTFAELLTLCQKIRLQK